MQSLRGSLAGRVRWGIVFALLLFACSAAPVLADSPPEPSPSLDVPSVPLPNEEDIASGIARLEREEEEQAKQLATPEAMREREASASAYSDASAQEAEQLLSAQFSELLAALNADPARFLSDATIDKPLGEFGAKVTDDEGDTQLLESSVPVRAKDEEGQLKKVDLSLESTSEGYEPQNPLVELDIGKSADEGVEVGKAGLAITQVAAEEGGAGRLYGDKNVFYPEVGADTDLLVSPVGTGVELFDQLRSAESPETLRFHFDLPTGAELRSDGAGGAVVVSGDGSTLASVPAPSAVGAQGTPLPVALEVEGSAIVLQINHREAEVAYPVLVDPEVKTDGFGWYWGNDIPALENGTWGWDSNDNGQIVHSTSCIYTCWGSGRGLYISTTNANFPANAYGQWYYNAPGQTTYIPSIYPTPSATLNPFFRDNHGCSWEKYHQPHDYDGVWDGANWTWLETDRAQWYGNATIFTKGKTLIFGMSAGGGVNIPCWRDIMASGVSVWLDDPEAPTISSVTGIPTGWVKKDATPRTINVTATDPGLGVQYVRLLSPGNKEYLWNQPSCTGLWNNRCASTRSGQITFNTEGNYEGKVPISVQAFDPTGKGYNPQEYTLLVDGTSPTINLSGQLAKVTAEEGKTEEPQAAGNDELSLPTYNLKIEAADGSPTELRSGVKEIKVFLDKGTTPVASQSQSCPAGSCPMTMTFPLKLTGLTQGKHTLKVVANDQAGNEVKPERKIEFEYIPATGMKDEYVLQHIPLPDGHDHSEEEEPHGPEIAVNVMNGNLVYHERDINVEGRSADLELERSYNSQLPTEKDTQWGRGWTVAQAPELKPQPAESPPTKATMLQTSGAITSAVRIPESESQQTFNPKLNAAITKAPNGDYEVTYEDREEEPVFDASGRIQEARYPTGAAVKYDYTTQYNYTFEAKYIRQFGSQGVGNGQFSYPEGIAADSHGNIWVADTGNNRVQEFNEEGKYVRQFGSEGAGNGQFRYPEGIAVDSKGNVWVADGEDSRVEELTEKGEYIRQFGSEGAGNGQLRYPMGIAADAYGNVWVADCENHRIQEFTEKGEYIRQFGSEGTGNGQFIYPEGIAVDSKGNVWVADTYNSRIQEFTEKGEFIRKFGSPGSGDGQLSDPVGITIDSKGNVWVADSENSRIQEFNEEGEFIAKFNSPGFGKGQFSGPRGVALDPKGNVWVGDTYNNLIQEFSETTKSSPTGEVLTEIAVEDPATASDPSVDLNVANGLVKSTEGEEAGRDTYHYESGKLTAEQDTEGETKYGYDSNGRLNRVELPNGTVATVAYDTTSRATAVTVDPAGPEEAKTTHFWYGTEPRETKVWGGGNPEVIYSIGEDGSVFKWSYAEVEPAFDSIGGSLWANANSTTPVENKDHTLFVVASSPHEIANVQFLVDGNVAVDEKTCEDNSEPPAHNCEHVKLEWITNAAAHPAGQLNIEAIITDFLGHSAAKRFFVTIPQQPPPDPEAEAPPTFEQIKHFREEMGLDLDIKGNEEAINQRCLNLLYRWEIQEPVARSSAERWGVPLRPEDVAELEYRDRYVAQAATVIPQWANSNAPGAYAGYYVDNPAGGIIRVGFKENQGSLVEALKQQAGLMAPERVSAFAYQPTRSLADLYLLEGEVGEMRATRVSRQGVIVSSSVDVAHNGLNIGATDVARVNGLLTEWFGTIASFSVYFEASIAPHSRLTVTGPVLAGDGIENPNYACTAGGGARWKMPNTKPDGSPIFAHFILTAGHCFIPSESQVVSRRRAPGDTRQPQSVKLGKVTRDALPLTGGYETDGEAIRLEENALVPRRIYEKNNKSSPINGVEAVPPVGTMLCFSGITSNRVRCGPVAGEPKEVEYYEPEENLVSGPMWQIQIAERSLDGDSGSPVWNPATGNLVGVLSSGNTYITPFLPMPGLQPSQASQAPGIMAALGWTATNVVTAP